MVADSSQIGRPSAYSQETADKVLELLGDGMSLRELCEAHPELPKPSTIRRWITFDVEGFRDKYARVKASYAEVYAEEIIAIADDSSGDDLELPDGRIVANNEFINRSRLRVDTRKWLMSKLLPKKYGDRLEVETTGKDGSINVLVLKVGENGIEDMHKEKQVTELSQSQEQKALPIS